MNILPFAICGLAGMATVVALTPLLVSLAHSHGWLHRSGDFHHTHKTPIPRVGGLALALAFLAVELVLTIFFPDSRGVLSDRYVVLLTSLAMFALGFWDDLRPLGAKRKLIGQILIATAVYYNGIGIQGVKIPFTQTIWDLHGAGYLLTLLWLVGMTNLINLIDGVDGLAGGICMMLMILLVYVGFEGGNLALVAAGMAGALLGFLCYNFPPARVYLGDGGAYFLGFQIGLFSLISSQKGSIIAALAAPLFVLALPIVDTALAILRRGLRGLPLFRPDRRHLHHHLLGAGHSRRRVVFIFYGATLVFLVMGLVAYSSQGRLVPALLGLAAWFLLFFARGFRFSRQWFSIGHVVGNSLQMRQEVQYALSLTNWLALEAERCRSPQDFWPNLVFVARKLNFTGLKLTLGNEERSWGKLLPGEGFRIGVYDFQRLGKLECSAHINSESNPPNDAGVSLTPQSMPQTSCTLPVLLFEILGELVAEAWMKNASRWKDTKEGMLRFESQASSIRPLSLATSGAMDSLPLAPTVSDSLH